MVHIRMNHIVKTKDSKILIKFKKTKYSDEFFCSSTEINNFKKNIGKSKIEDFTKDLINLKNIILSSEEISDDFLKFTNKWDLEYLKK